MILSLKKTIGLLCITTVMTALSCMPALAESSMFDLQSINRTMREVAKQEQLNKDLATKEENKNTENIINSYKASLIDLQYIKDEEQGQSSFLGPQIESIYTEKVTSDLLAEQTKQQINDTSTQAISGNEKIEDGSSDGSTANPLSGIAIENDAALQKIYDKNFCNPASLNASEECIAQGSKAVSTNVNFVDFILGSGTWTDKKTIDMLTLANRFFAGLTDKMMLNQGTYDISSFIQNEGMIAQAGLRMGIIHDLASERAPTSQSTDAALGLLFKVLAPSGHITSLNADTVCTNENNVFIESLYACSLTAVQNNKRVISQAAMDRILHFDYMLSFDFYNKINAPEVMATGGIDKVAVYLKAQQLAQDYRALRLLQMKVAATAMNIMNGKK